MLKDTRKKYGAGQIVKKSYQALKKKYENHVKDVVEDYGDDYKISNAPSQTRKVTPEEAKQILKVVNNYEIPFGGTEGTLDRLFQYELEMVAAGKKPQKLNHWWFAVDDSMEDSINTLTPNEGLELALNYAKKSKPMKVTKSNGGLLEDEREKYGAGQLVKSVLNLKKGAAKATGRATEEARLQKEFDSLMKEHYKDLDKLDELKKSNATEKQLTDLKDKIRNDIEDLMILEDSLDAFKNYSPGGRRGEAAGGMLSDDRQAYGLGQIVKKAIKKYKREDIPEGLQGFDDEIHYYRMEGKPLKKQIVYLEDSIEELYNIRKGNLKEIDELNEQLKDKNITKEVKESLTQEKRRLFYRNNDINKELDTIADLLEEKGVNPRIEKEVGGMLSDDRQRYGLGSIVKQGYKAIKELPDKMQDTKDEIVEALTKAKKDEGEPENLRAFFNEIHYDRMRGKPLKKQIVYLEDSIEDLYKYRQRADAEVSRISEELKKKNITREEKERLYQDLADSEDEIFDINSELDNLEDLLKEKGVNPRIEKDMGGLLSDDRQAYGLGQIVKSFIKKNPSKNTRKIKKLEKELDETLADYRSLEDYYEQEMKNAKKEGMSAEEIKDIDEKYYQHYRLYDDNIDIIVDELDELGIKVSAKNLKERQRPSPKESGDYTEPLEQLNTGGLLSRQQYGLGQLVSKGISKIKRAKEIREIKKDIIEAKKNRDDSLEKLKKIKEQNASSEDLYEYTMRYRDNDDYVDELERELKYWRSKKNMGGSLSNNRQRYGLGQVVKKFIKQAEKNKAKAKKKQDDKYPEYAMDDSTDMADRGKIDMETAIRLLDDGEEFTKVQDALVMSGYTKKDAKELISIYRMDIDIAKPNMTQEEIFEEYDRLGLKEGGSMDDQMMMVMNVEPMESDDVMEDNYTNFIMEEALSEEEENMLVSKLEQDKELQMLFDKVIDVAQEFAGSGPVEGPGSGVSDSIPARLSDGEFVFTAKATEQIGEDKLMSMMKEAEAQADERQKLFTGTTPLSEEEKMLEEIEISDSKRVARKISDNMMDPYTQDRYVRS